VNEHRSRPLGVRIAGRLGAIIARLVLIVVIVVATGLLIGAMVLPGALAADRLLAAVRNDVLDVPPLGEADTPPQNSYVYAADGTELAELTFEENRVPVTLDEIPQVAIDAVLATEDAEFYEHQGVNHLAIARAALTNFRAGGIESGASTITQQYVKLTFLSPEQTLARKMEEAIYAIQLERELTKDEILERYLNRSYFGVGVYGIGTAAERYFSKDIGDLTLGEAAMLAGLLRAPEANNPINNFDNAQARRDIVLRQMAQHSFVTPAQAQAAIDQPLEVTISEPPAPSNPFWSSWIASLLINENTAAALGTQEDALEAMGPTREERRRFVFQSGLQIHTTLDLELQEEAEAALRRALLPEEYGPEDVALAPMGSIVSIEPGSGAIRTLAVGPHTFGSCFEDGQWAVQLDSGELLCDRTTVNVAVPGMGASGRQPGSSFKPFVMTAALEDGISAGLTLDAREPQAIEGCPSDSTESGLWEPRNSGGNDILDMYGGIARSSNIYAALMIAEVGPSRAAEVFERVSGFPIPPDDVVCPLALGTTDVMPLAMASAYATFANRGEYCAPYPIERIEGPSGRVLWEHSGDCEQVLDTEVADRIVDVLAGPVSPGGTAPVANLGSWPTRGKTGTTNDNRDAWFIGFIRQLATSVWVGYPNNNRIYETEEQARAACGEPLESNPRECLRTAPQLMTNVTIGGQGYSRVFGGTIPAPIFADYMGTIVDRYEPEGFPDPGPLPTAPVPDLLQASTIEEAEEIALAAGFRLDVDEVEDYRPEGTFVGQRPEAGTRQALGARITLEVSDGTGEPPAIPDLIGLTLEEASTALFELGYRNLFSRNVPVEDEDLWDLVVGLEPEAGTRVDPEDPEHRIVLLIGREPPEPEPEEPDEGDEDGEPGEDGGDDEPDEDASGPPGRGRPPGNRDDA
jgi:penicillin-binding protein 1A